MTDVRGKLGKDLEDRYGKLVSVLDAAIDAKKVHRAKCPNPKCGRDVSVTIPDIPGMIKAAQFWIDQGLGKVGSQDDTDEALLLAKDPLTMDSNERKRLMLALEREFPELVAEAYAE